MARTDNFRKQHVEILTIAREINQQLGAVIAEEDATRIRRQLSKMHGLVGLHLAMEDKSLYPSMLLSKDQEARDLAQRYSQEMGDLAHGFEAYMKAWSNISLISASPEVFTEQTKAIFNALSKRIHRENTLLYPVADALP
ncbi:hemerythrin domain-containing protein [Rugamonas sp.]|uniref:hemerythrin domain-containing protein n=1 Tax=Rugamonas sp. TaxID=1926287 RepID=UPI0025DBD482|nr:hemerythrin domain-containing protein [Rugamonas sp.]